MVRRGLEPPVLGGNPLHDGDDKETRISSFVIVSPEDLTEPSRWIGENYPDCVEDWQRTPC